MTNETAKYHFFVTTAYDWRTDDTLHAALERLPIWHAGDRVEIWKVPGDKTDNYRIEHYAPQVEGAEMIYSGSNGKAQS